MPLLDNAQALEIDLTPQFLRLRGAKRSKFNFDARPAEGRQRLLDNYDEAAVELEELSSARGTTTAAWLTVLEDCNDALTQARDLLAQYRVLCRERHLLASSQDSDRVFAERAEALSAQIQSAIQHCRAQLRQLDPTDCTDEWDRQLRSNVRYGLKLQLRVIGVDAAQISQSARKQQQPQQQPQPQPPLSHSTTATSVAGSVKQHPLQQQQQLQRDGELLERLEAEARQRNLQIDQLAGTMAELQSLFASLDQEIILQGSLLDRIDYNLENTAAQAASAARHVEKAVERHNNSCAGRVILTLLVSDAVLSFFLVLKWTR